MKQQFLSSLFGMGILGVTALLIAGEASRLVVPPLIYAVPGVSLSMHLESALLDGVSVGESLEVESPVKGVLEDGIWRFTASEEEVGDHVWILRLRDAAGEVLDEVESVIRIAPADAGVNDEFILLFVGDSLTHSSLYPNEVARLLSRPGNPDWKMLGMHRPAAAAEGVSHEGYGSWTWERFNTWYFPDKPAGDKLGSSPFLFPDENGVGVLDVEKYVAERCGGLSPDLVIFFLGINDCFHVDSKDPAAIEARIDEMCNNADVLLAAFQVALPDARFGVCLTPAPNGRESAFQANYKGAYTREGWRRIQFRLVERQLEHFGDRERVSIIPLSLAVDPMQSYPAKDSVHPNKAGSDYIGGNIYAWIKSQLASPGRIIFGRRSAN